MKQIELNKIVGAVLLAILVVTAIRLIGDGLFESKEPQKEAAKEAATPGAPAPEAPAPAEKPAPAATPEAKPAAAGAAVGGDPAAGQAVFKAHLCFGCHKFEPGKHTAGPSLAGVYGREAGEAEGFAYSDALKNSGIVWNDEALDKWVQAPKNLIAGTKMVLVKPVTDPKNRADLIAYLKKASGS